VIKVGVRITFFAMAALYPEKKPRANNNNSDFVRAGSPCPHKKMQLIRSSLDRFQFSADFEPFALHSFQLLFEFRLVSKE
jgi:hypothetical protein